MAAAQSFCVRPPSEGGGGGGGGRGGGCTAACLSADHALVPVLPFELQGGGWNGAYYFIRPYSAFESAAKTSAQAVFAPDDQQSAPAPGSVADTLESGFGEVKLQCLPAKSQCYMLQLSFAKEYLDEGTPYITTYT